MKGPLELRFGDDDVVAVYHTLSGVLDLALTEQGASVGRLEQVDLGLRELLDHLACFGVVGAKLLQADANIVVELTCSTRVLEMDATGSDIVGLGFHSVGIDRCRVLLQTRAMDRSEQREGRD